MTNAAFEQTVTSTTCPYCGVGCGVDVTVTNGTSTELKGNDNHQANFGKLCVKGSNLLDTVTPEGRLTQPKVNGDIVDWDTAIDATAKGLKSIIDAHGPDAVAFYVSGQLLTEDYYVANKLIKGYIGTANIDTNSRLCMSSAVAAYKRAFGSDTVPCNYEDLESTELLVLVGSNAAWTHPILFQRMQQAKRQNPNLQIVVIDPRFNATAQQSDLFMPINPGTDIALFNGLLNYLNEHHHLDQEFINTRCNHWPETKEIVASYTIDCVADICGLNPTLVHQFYQLFASTEKVISFYSQGVNQSIQGVDKCNAIINCHLATGRIGKIGAGPFSITGQPNAMGGREVGGLANMLAAHMDIDNPSHRELVQEFWQSPTMCQQQGLKAVDMFDAIKQGKIKAVWVMATNPLVSLPNQTEIELALEKCELVIVSDCMAKNDTLKYANIELPVTGWSEKDGTVTNSERRISRQRGFLPATENARHDWQIMSDVAKRMGFEQGFNYQHQAEVFAEHAALSCYKNSTDEVLRDFNIEGLTNLDVRQYNNLKPIQWPVTRDSQSGQKRMFEDQLFFTPDRKAKFIPVQFKGAKLATNDEFPFILNSGRYRDHWHTMTRTGLSSTLSRHLMQPQLHIHAKDAQTLGLQEDDIVQVRSAFGQVQLKAHISAEQRQGQVFAPIHWNDQTASNAKVSRCFSSNVDAISGQPDSKYVPVTLEKLPMTQFVQIFTRVELTISSDYWVKVRTPYGFHYIIANQQTQSLQALRELLPKTQNSQTFENTDASQNCMIHLEQHLETLVLTSTQNTPVVLDWIDYLFEQDEVISSDISRLFSESIEQKFTNGKTICSCHQIGENQIIEHIQNGCDSVEALGDALKCGTKCGSCKPELSQLLQQHSSSNKQKFNLDQLIKTENSYV